MRAILFQEGKKPIFACRDQQCVLMVSSLVAGTTAMMGRNLERNIIPHCIDVYDQTLNSQTLPSIAKAGNQKRPLVSATA